MPFNSNAEEAHFACEHHAHRAARRHNFQQRATIRNLVLHSMEPDEMSDDDASFPSHALARGKTSSFTYHISDKHLQSKICGQVTNNSGTNGSIHEVVGGVASKDRISECKSQSESKSDVRSILIARISRAPATPAPEDETSANVDSDSLHDIACNERQPNAKRYAVETDYLQNDRANEIPLFSAARPHMRAFHLAWVSFFVAFFAWFALTPLLSEIQYTLNLTKHEIWISSILAIVASTLTRVAAGPLNDKYGARRTMSATLVMTAIPLGLAGLLIQSASSLYWIRFMIGIAGSAFVGCQSWISAMFTVEIAGTAQALAAGWANLAGGVAQVVMGSLLFPLFKIIYGGDGYNQATEERLSPHDSSANDRAAELAWRTIPAIPAILCLYMAYAVIRFSDDTPRGNVSSLRSECAAERTSASDMLRRGASSWNTWILSIQYGCCFGVEVAMTQAACLYFQDEFGQTVESAAAIASVFGWMNIFARAIGGFLSDVANVKFGMRGRLWTQVILLLLEGSIVVAFSHAKTLVGAIFVLILSSIFVSAAAGSTFAVVPYVDYFVMGSISGIVGAGGSLFGIFYLVLFLKLNYEEAFVWMGCSVLASSLLTTFVSIGGYRGLFVGKDSLEVQQQRRLAGLPDEITIPRQEV